MISVKNVQFLFLFFIGCGPWPVINLMRFEKKTHGPLVYLFIYIHDEGARTLKRVPSPYIFVNIFRFII